MAWTGWRKKYFIVNQIEDKTNQILMFEKMVRKSHKQEMTKIFQDSLSLDQWGFKES